MRPARNPCFALMKNMNALLAESRGGPTNASVQKMSKSWLKTPQEQLRDFGDLFDKTKKKWPEEEFDYDLSGVVAKPDVNAGRETDVDPSGLGFASDGTPSPDSPLAQDFSHSHFDGQTYEPKFDSSRLRGEMSRVYEMMRFGDWRTLSEIREGIRERFQKFDSEAGISARLRDFRKRKWGSHTVNRRRRGDPKRGIFEYQLL